MRAYNVIDSGAGVQRLEQVDLEMPGLGDHEVMVRVHYCSINYRDQLLIKGGYGRAAERPFIPMSDGVGEVVAVGARVAGFSVGDKVASTFFRSWIDGPLSSDAGAALGSSAADGMLREFAALPATNLVHVAQTLTLEQAACLPCAGVTAWNALMEGACPVRPGDCVLVLGTGGVSVIALQIARMAGARVIATSSSDAKLERMTVLGAAHTINYRSTPDWGIAAAELAGPAGITHVVEVGGAGTLANSLQAAGYNSEIALVGVMTDGGPAAPMPRMGRGTILRYVSVGSNRMAERLNAAIDVNAMKPVVDRVFPFAEVDAALAYQRSSEVFGKVVISI